MTEDRNQKLVERLAEMSLREQRARRRWGVFFRLVFFGYIGFLTAAYFYHQPEDFAGKPHLAVISINGIIAANSDNNAARINETLRVAFAEESARGVVLRINSPGGSVVESNRIYQEIRRLRAKYPNKKVYAVAGDFCASGGYYVAAATDQIYVDENSLVGSIGVIFSSFGFVDAMKKLGVERRVQTAGDSKNMFDPFSPQDPEMRGRVENIIDAMHENFKTAVREGRGARLLSRPDIFEGAVFVGTESVSLGLADGVGDTFYVAHQIVGVEEIIYYDNKSDWLDVVWDNVSLAVMEKIIGWQVF